MYNLPSSSAFFLAIKNALAFSVLTTAVLRGLAHVGLIASVHIVHL